MNLPRNMNRLLSAWFYLSLFNSLLLCMDLFAQQVPLPAKVDDAQSCEDCHPLQQRQFQHSVMARAASSQAFLDEQSRSAQPGACLRCHAPLGGEGVTCVDCHGAGPHPYVKADGNGERVWTALVRFGWEHHGKEWRDHTLPASTATQFEVADPGREGATTLNAQLIYRFRPGSLQQPDPSEVILDSLEMLIP
jgi:hypothetical protein